MKMRLNKLLVPLAFSMLFSGGVTAASTVFDVDDISELETEPTECFENGMFAFEGAGAGGAAIPLLLELCSGARDAEVVLGCFVKSMASKEEGGLGLTLSMAVGLCKQNG